MPTDSIVYEAKPGEVRVWNFSAMRTELLQPVDVTTAEWKAGDWIQKDDEGRLTQMTEPPLTASSNETAKLIPVKAIVPVVRVPDFHAAFGLSTAVDRNKRFFSPVVGPVDNYEDASVFPENVLLDMSVCKCSDHMKIVVQKNYGVASDWLFSLKQEAPPVTSEAEETYEMLLGRWGRSRRNGVVLKSMGSSHVIGYESEDGSRRLCVARDDSLSFGQQVSFYLIDVGFNAPVQFAAGCRPQDRMVFCQDGDQVLLLPPIELTTGFVFLPYLGAIAVRAEFEERTEGQKSIAFRLQLDLQRGSVNFSALMPPPPKTPPPTATDMASSSPLEQYVSRNSESFAENTEETQASSTSAHSASHNNSNKLESTDPLTFETKMARMEDDISNITIEGHANGLPISTVMSSTGQHQRVEAPDHSSKSTKNEPQQRKPLPTAAVTLPDTRNTTSASNATASSDASSRAAQANTKIPEGSASTRAVTLETLLSNVFCRDVIGVVCYHHRDKIVDQYYVYSPEAGIEAGVFEPPAGIMTGKWLKFNVVVDPLDAQSLIAVQAQIVPEVFHVVPMWRSAAVSPQSAFCAIRVECEVEVPESRPAEGELLLGSTFAQEVRDPYGVAKDKSAGAYAATIRYHYDGNEPTGHWVLEYIDDQK